MPSQDTFHQERPETNRALLASLPESERQRVTGQVGNTPATSRTAKRVPQAARVQALAARLGEDPEELAKRIPEDTLRRLKYPMLVQPQGDGTTQFKHDNGIIRGDVRRPLLATDRAYDDIEQNASPARDERGRFTK